MQSLETVASSNSPTRNTTFHSCCFFFRLNVPDQIFPPQFQAILIKHQCNQITLREGYKTWIIKLNRQWFGDGWQEFCRSNILRQSDSFLLRHSGNLVFDVIHFSEDRQQARMPWTDPLPNILHIKPSFGSEINGKLRIVRQRVLSSMKPDFANNLIEGACFYQIVTGNTQHKFKIPRFTLHCSPGDKTPSVTLRIRNKTITVTMHGRPFIDNWDIFAVEHQLELGEILAFLPESSYTYTVIIFDKYGVEKQLSWYHSFHVYSFMKNESI